MTARAVSVLFASTIAIAVAVNYQNSEILSSKYKFFWTYNTTEENLYFKVEVDASGWVGLGFSDTNSGMANMDCIVGGVFAGTLGYLNDYHVDGTARPIKDLTQSYSLERSAEVNGKTTMEFSRTRNTFDSNDMMFTVGKDVYVAFAHHDNQEATNSRSFLYHGLGRGQYSTRRLEIASVVTPKPTMRAPNMTTPSHTASSNPANEEKTTKTTRPTKPTTVLTPASQSERTQVTTYPAVLFVLSLTLAIAFLY